MHAPPRPSASTLRVGLALCSLIVLIVLVGCAQSGPSGGAAHAPDEHVAPPAPTTAPLAGAPATASVVLEGVPHVHQRPDFCGEACVESVLRWRGVERTQDDVFRATGLAPVQGRGAYTRELDVALRAIGFEVGAVWHSVSAADAERELEALWQALLADLRAGVPSIVCTHYDEAAGTPEHFRLVLGYDADTDEVIYHEPAEPDGAYARMPKERFLRLWPLTYDAEQWTVVRFRLAGDTLALDADTAAPTTADYAQRVQSLAGRVGPEFTAAIEPPFVVMGDEEPDVVERRAANTVRWATTLLERDFFATRPARIIDIWLFKDERSYTQHARALFHEDPGTPYGYYSSEADALVMNIATGGGTLVHEMVHPYIEADFPACPSWFNEGLASLFEQCGERDGHIRGATNWRLAGLQELIAQGSLPSFATLLSTSTRGFYRDDIGDNYAQARYLCYYLQEKGLLRDFYTRFRANVAHDPTGLETLAAVLGTDDLVAFQREWEAWVMELRFR